MFLTTQDISDIDLACGLRPDSMTKAQAASISASLGETWSIDWIVSCDRSLALLLTPPDGIDTDMAFHVALHDGGLDLSIMQGDDLRLHGCYGASVGALLAAVRAASAVV